MFVVGDFHDGRYSLIELSDTAAQTRATVCPERGGLVCSFALNELESVYLDRDTFENLDKNVRGGMPILFPICGPLRDGEWRGHRMPQHGVARQSAWEVVHSGSDVSAWTELRLTSTAATRAMFPFDFELLFRYELRGHTLTLKQSYHNPGSRTMPFQTGLHPYFAALKPNLQWQIPADRYLDNDDRQAGKHPFNGSIPLDRTVDWEFPHVHAPQAGVSLGNGLSVTMRVSEQYRFFVVWSLQDSPFVCLEPWSGPRFGLNDEDYLLECAPGETLHTWVSFELQETLD